MTWPIADVARCTAHVDFRGKGVSYIGLHLIQHNVRASAAE
jgi:hypothetical protein